MIIGIDGNEANVTNKVGISEYAFELLQQFSLMQQKEIVFRTYLKEKPAKDFPKEHNNWQYRVVKPTPLWTQIGLPFDLVFHKPHPDIFFSPTHYAPRFSTIPQVIAVMDLSFLYFPSLFKAQDLYKLTHWTAYSVRKAARVLTISNSTKNDIIKTYKITPEKVVVTYPGIKQNEVFTQEVKYMKKTTDRHKTAREYILFVGTLQPRKNIVRLIAGFSQIAEMYGDIDLVVVGKKGWLYEEILEAPKKYNVEKRVIFLDFVSDEKLKMLYQDAVCFVLPSLYEGFGLPVLEAMQYGCPVITSNISSLPEAAGDAALYVNPLDVSDIAKKISMLIQNKTLRKQLREKGFNQIKKFSWEKTAKETLSVLEEVAKGGI